MVDVDVLAARLNVCLFVNRTQYEEVWRVAVLFSIFLELQPAECPSIFRRWEIVFENGRPAWTSAIAVENVG